MNARTDDSRARTGCAIVVSHDPDVSALMRLLQRISQGGCHWLLIDNASSNFQQFRIRARELRGCLGIESLPVNQGLGRALNIGLQRASDKGYAFAILFDQDSEPAEDFFAELYAAHREARALVGDRVAAVGAAICHPADRRRLPFKRFSRLRHRTDQRVPGTRRLFHADFLITSGTLIPIEPLRVIGMMREDYFIDNIDLEWCFRARANGYALFGTDRAILLHRIGEASDHPLVRGGLMVQHGPQRSYYATRNRFHLYRQRHAPLDWKLRDFCRFVLKSAFLLLSSSQRAAYWQNIRRGIRDSGKLP